MFNIWAKSVPVCSDAAEEKRLLEDLARKSLTGKQNSSGLFPKLAVFHNENSKDSNKHLLSLPNSIQAQIFRYVLHHEGEYIVSIKRPDLCKEPNLLTVSKDARAIARPIFYRETSFQCTVDSFNVMALQPWVEMRQKAMQTTVNMTNDVHIGHEAWANRSTNWQRSRQGQMAAYQKNKFNNRKGVALPAPTPIFWATDNNSNWANVVQWLMLYHAKKIERFRPPGRLEPKHVVLEGVFEIVRALRVQPWSLVENVLAGAKTALVAVDGKWAAYYPPVTNGQTGGGDGSNFGDDELQPEDFEEIDAEAGVHGSGGNAVDGFGGNDEYDDDETDSGADMEY